MILLADEGFEAEAEGAAAPDEPAACEAEPEAPAAPAEAPPAEAEGLAAEGEAPPAEGEAAPPEGAAPPAEVGAAAEPEAPAAPEAPAEGAAPPAAAEGLCKVRNERGRTSPSYINLRRRTTSRGGVVNGLANARLVRTLLDVDGLGVVGVTGLVNNLERDVGASGEVDLPGELVARLRAEVDTRSEV